MLEHALALVCLSHANIIYRAIEVDLMNIYDVLNDEILNHCPKSIFKGCPALDSRHLDTCTGG